MITYQEIYDILRKEKYAEQLQELPKNFLNEVANYLNEKKAIVGKEHDMFSDAIVKAKKQLENSVAVIKELFLRRKKKILDLAFVAAETGISKRDFENMLQYEKDLFEVITQKLEEIAKVTGDIINGVQEKQLQNKLVRFDKDTDSFLDAEGNVLGPFKKGEMANINSEIAKILIESGKASQVDND
jgi:DNA replication initiation complex subunit (GINS family)